MITTELPHTLRSQRLDALVELMRRSVRFSRRVTSRRTSTARVVAARDRHPSGATITIDTIDDPDGTIRLIGVRGTITARNAHQLLGAARGLDTGVVMHIDLTDASIPNHDGFRRLEATIDEIERRGVKLHVVGVDPAHPALSRH